MAFVRRRRLRDRSTMGTLISGALYPSLFRAGSGAGGFTAPALVILSMLQLTIFSFVADSPGRGPGSPVRDEQLGFLAPRHGGGMTSEDDVPLNWMDGTHSFVDFETGSRRKIDSLSPESPNITAQTPTLIRRQPTLNRRQDQPIELPSRQGCP